MSADMGAGAAANRSELKGAVMVIIMVMIDSKLSKF